MVADRVASDITVPTPSRRAPTLADVQSQRRRVVRACQQHGASHPRVFGSVARGDARPDSDIDILVDLERGRTLADVVALQEDLETVLRREVDVVTSGAAKGRMATILDKAVAL